MLEMTADILIWWLAILVVGWIVLPVIGLIFHSFRDRGYFFAKIFGLALISYLVYVFANLRLLPFHIYTIMAAGVLCLLAECVLLLCSKRIAVRVTELFQDKKVLLYALLEEVLFLSALFLWAYLRSRTPALNHTEMFMDHGFVKSLMNAEYLPSPDMWYAGAPINYYYYGQYVTAFLCKLTGQSSGVGYNLMMATLFAMTLTGSFLVTSRLLSVKKGLSKAWKFTGGIISAVMVTLAGNAHSFLYGIIFPLWNRMGLMQYSYQHGIDRYWYPDATRYIHCFEGSTDSTITEFPLYSFVLSDLHAHVIDIIFVLLFLALLTIWIYDRTKQPQMKQDILMLLLLGFIIGIMGMTNYWDFAIYLVVFLFFAVYRAYLQGLSWKSPRFYLTVGGQALCLFLICELIMLPFTLYFDSIHVGLAFATDHSPIGEYLVLWLLPMTWTGWLFFYCIRKKGETGESDFMAVLLGVCALGLIAAPEFLYIKDIYTSAPRCNTMFKFTYEAFILFGLICGYTLVCVMSGRHTVRARILTGMAMAVLLLPPLCYPYFAIHEVYFTGDNAGTLDGLRYIEQENAAEYAAIRWIDENTAADAVLLEGNGISYTTDNRISMATGRQTVQGWWTHEMLWRNLSADALDVRIRDIREIYEGTDPLKTRELLDQYGVDYICIGEREREAFPQMNEEKLRNMSQHVYDFNGQLLLER